MGALHGPLPEIWVKSQKPPRSLFQICDIRPLPLDFPHGRPLTEGPACDPCRGRL